MYDHYANYNFFKENYLKRYLTNNLFTVCDSALTFFFNGNPGTDKNTYWNTICWNLIYKVLTYKWDEYRRQIFKDC